MANTLSKGAYIRDHIVWNLVLFVWGKIFFFRRISNYTYMESFLIWLFIALIVTGIGIFLTWEENRNFLNIVENIIMTWSGFVVLAYIDVYKKRMILVGLITAIVSVLMTILILCRRIIRQDKRRQIIRRRLFNTVTLWRRNITCASLFVMIPLAISVGLRGTYLNSNVEVVKVYGDEHRLDANIDVIADIAPERWVNLDIQQKLNVCQKIINCEARYLGLSHEITVGTAELPEKTVACYSETQHQIVVNIDYLNNLYSYDILETLIHECTHAYQHEQVDVYKTLDETSRNLLMFYDASIYMEEFANYEDGDHDYLHYYTQRIEKDARYAAATQSVEYVNRIEEYLSSKN